jgi:hypothetical protein
LPGLSWEARRKTAGLSFFGGRTTAAGDTQQGGVFRLDAFRRATV